MGISLEVGSQNFSTEVLEKSYEKPVLVDFFAQWCGPCQMLKPMLEKLTQEYDFVLAKVDIDQNPDLANAYHVEGVPDVRVVTQGEVNPGFVGVLPEPQLRDLLNQLGLKSDLARGLDQIRTVMAAGDVEQAKQLFSELIQKYPEERELILAAAKFLIGLDKLESAEKLLAVIQEHERAYFDQAQALRSLIQLKQEVQNPESSHPLDAQYFKAAQLTLQEEYEAALQLFLEIVGQDRKYRQDGARKAMITVFGLLGDDHPLTKSYRKQLMMALY